MDEIIDIVTSEGKPTGKTALKSEAHKLGLYHQTIHVWLFTSDGKILLQQRAKTKSIYPLLWDVSVAGHIGAGETIKEAALRETKEEIGLDIFETDLQKIGEFECFKSYENQIFDNEFQHTFISELKVNFSELIKQDEEVEALKLVSISEFMELLKNTRSNNHFIETNKSYYQLIFDKIILAIKN